MQKLGLYQPPPLFNSRGYEIVAGPFGRAASEDGRFHVDEVVLVEIVAHDLHHAVPQQQCLLYLRPAQVDVSMFEADLLGWQRVRARLERRRLARIENLDRLHAEFNVARFELGVSHALGPHAHGAGHAGDKLGSQSAGDFEVIFASLGPKHDLGATISVAEVDEEDSAMVAPRIDPTGQGDGLSDVFFSQFTASMSPQQVDISTLLNG